MQPAAVALEQRATAAHPDAPPDERAGEISQ
jgi:hypothetical protein